MNIDPVWLPIIGVLLSIPVLVLHAENRAQISLARVFPRAIFGLACHALLWSLGLVVIFRLVTAWVNVPPLTLGLGLAFFAVAAAFPNPQNLIKLQLYRNIDQHKSALRSLIPIFRVLVEATEVTRLYVTKIINREERKLDDEFSRGGAENLRALEELWTRHLSGLIEARTLDVGARATKLARVTDTHVKFKLLLHYRGATDFFNALRSLNPSGAAQLSAGHPTDGDRPVEQRSASGLRGSSVGEIWPQFA